MAKTRLNTIRARNVITGQIRHFSPETFKRLPSRLINGEAHPNQGWVQEKKSKAPKPPAAEEAEIKAKEEAEKKAAEEAAKKAEEAEAAEEAEIKAKAEKAAKAAAEKSKKK